ncbi:hypothetical protein [Parasphingorhabdus pacifica]
MNPVLLIIVTALALTVLIFVSTLLRRPSTRRRAKHALGKSAGTAPAHGTSAVPAGAAAEPEAPGRTRETDDEPPTEPELPIAAAAGLPGLPSNLFERRYAGKFARLRRRTERLRSAVPKT